MPTAPQFNETGIPDDLKALDCWTLWKYGDQVNAKGKPGKIPVKVVQGKVIGQTARRVHYTYRAAVNLARRRDLGIGVWLGNGLIGADVDGIGEIQTMEDLPGRIRRLVKKMNTFTEISQGGDGIHVYGLSDAQYEHQRNASTGSELYWQKRFFVVTGNTLNGMHLNTVDFDPFYKSQIEIGNFTTTDIPDDIGVGGNPADGWQGTDQELIDHIVRYETRSELFDRSKPCPADMIRGIGTDAWKSQSEVDAAICNHLAYYIGRDPERIERVFRKTLWFREYRDEKGVKKWNDRPEYVKATIETAFRGRIKWWQHKGEADDGEDGADVEKFTDAPRLIDIVDQLPPLMQEVFHDIARTAVYPRPEFNIHTTIFLIGALVNNKATFDGVWGNFYLKLLAETGAGKNTALAYVSHVLRSVNPEIETIEEIGSAQGLEDALFDNEGKLVYVADEDMPINSDIGLVLSNKESKIFTRVGTKGFKPRQLSRAGDRAGVSDRSPLDYIFYSKIAATTLDTHFDLSSHARVLSGEGARTMLAVGDHVLPQRNDHRRDPELLPSLEAWYDKTLPKDFSMETDPEEVIKFKPRVLRYGEDALEASVTEQNKVDKRRRMSDDVVERAIWSRVGEHAKRIAFLCALAENPRARRVSAEWIRVGYDFMSRYATDIITPIHTHVRTGDRALDASAKALNVVQDVLRGRKKIRVEAQKYLLKRKMIPRTTVSYFCPRVSSSVFRQAEETLVDRGIIAVTPNVEYKTMTKTGKTKVKTVTVWRLIGV